MEELIAELGACFIAASLGLTQNPRDDHAAYIASWHKLLKEDSRAIGRAATAADRAAVYLDAIVQAQLAPASAPAPADEPEALAA